MSLYIGLMSGTSLDGIDAVLACLSPHIEIKAHLNRPWSIELKKKLFQLRADPQINLSELGQIHMQCADELARSVDELLHIANMKPNEIRAIGCHGQTIYHHPYPPYPFSWQIGHPQMIAMRSGIDTVADFRTADILAGGQGAPLVPAFHQAVFQNEQENRLILNIGGIANITYLPIHSDPIGLDTGPGNTLMDQWIQAHGQDYDRDGAWAQSGQCIPTLLQELLADPYFEKKSPKSTGTEYFNLNRYDFSPYPAQDVQATLLELTAQSIVQSIEHFNIDRIYVCGGGVHNLALMNRLKDLMQPIPVQSTASAGLDPDWVEALAFAWLAQQRLHGRPANLPSVTGAKKAVLLGTIYQFNGILPNIDR